jgi:hypothetical protein
MKLLSLLVLGGIASALPAVQVGPIVVAGRERIPTIESIRAAAAMPLYRSNVSAQAGTSDMVGYVEFSAGVTEYCEEHDGTVQQKASGSFWIPGTWDHFSYEDGHVAYAYNLGNPNVNLLVGPCKSRPALYVT